MNFKDVRTCESELQGRDIDVNENFKDVRTCERDLQGRDIDVEVHIKNRLV